MSGGPSGKIPAVTNRSMAIFSVSTAANPRLPEEREYKTWSAHGTCFAYTIATWCFLTGGYAAQLVGAVQGMVCLIAGNLIGTLLVSASLSAGCHRYGLEQIDFCKPAFGQNGARVVLIFYLINMLGWSGLILVMFGNGIVNIVEALGYHPPGWLVGAGVALGIWLTLHHHYPRRAPVEPVQFHHYTGTAGRDRVHVLYVVQHARLG